MTGWGLMILGNMWLIDGFRNRDDGAWWIGIILIIAAVIAWLI